MRRQAWIGRVIEGVRAWFLNSVRWEVLQELSEVSWRGLAERHGAQSSKCPSGDGADDCRGRESASVALGRESESRCARTGIR